MTDPNDNTSDIDVMARTLYGEARGEGDLGMKAVACVIMNRCKHATAYMLTHGHAHSLFGNGSPESACQAKWQFSCWNAGDPNCHIINDVDDSDPIFTKALQIASSAVNGLLDDITFGATHYYDRRMPEPPEWAEDKEPCASISHHLFFNNVS